MSLSELIAREVRNSKPGSSCSVGAALTQLSKADRDAAETAMAAHPAQVPAAAIERALKAAGHRIGHGAVGRHRKGQCACEPSR